MPIRVGVVGLGYFGSFHARHYAAHPDAELVAVADPSDERGAFARDTYGAAHFRDPRDLIGRVDAVSIAAPTALHDRIAPDFIDAGIHVLIEKPLAETAAGARDLAARAERRGSVLHVGHVERYSGAYRVLKAATSAPVLVECRRHAPWTGRVIDVDVVLDLMIHDIDLALDLVAAPVRAVSASGAELMGHGLDSVIARVEFANGTAAHLSASRVVAMPSRVIIVQERDRTLAADLTSRGFASFAAAGAEKTTTEIAPGDSLGLEIATFLEAVRGGADRGVSGREAVAALEVAEEIRRAARAAAQ